MTAPKVIDIQRLKTGAMTLNIDFDPRMTEDQLERAIVKHLKQDDSYGDYACPACERPITDIVPICPFCTVELVPLPEYQDEDFAVIEILDDNRLGEVAIEALSVKDQMVKRHDELEPIITRKSKRTTILKEAEKLNSERDRQRLLALLPINKEDISSMSRNLLMTLAAVLGVKEYNNKERFRLTKEELGKICYHTQVEKGFIPSDYTKND